MKQTNDMWEMITNLEEPQKLELFELVLIMLTKVYGEDAQLGRVLAEFGPDSGTLN